MSDKLEYVKVPLSKEDFTEDGITYKIPAKDFFRIISDLQERVEALERAVHLQQLRNF